MAGHECLWMVEMGEEITISELILRKISREHRGKENAIKRDELLEYCQAFDSELTDREMRKIYSELPVVSCNEGIFWPVRHEEIDEFETYLRKKALPLFKRFKLVAKEHRQLLSEKFTQWSLF